MLLRMTRSGIRWLWTATCERCGADLPGLWVDSDDNAEAREHKLLWMGGLERHLRVHELVPED
jgi:hypothetical protein